MPRRRVHVNMDEHDLAARLRGHGVAFDLLVAKERTPTVEAAARALGVAPDRIVKSVLFADKDAPGRHVLVLARGLSRVDAAKLARVRPGRWRLATGEECLRVTGYAPGTVPPVAHAAPLDVVMDEGVRALEELFAGGGGPLASLRIARADVERLTGCAVADVATPA